MIAEQHQSASIDSDTSARVTSHLPVLVRDIMTADPITVAAELRV